MWQVGELQQVSNRDLLPANKVGLIAEDGPQRVLNHPDRLGHLDLQGVILGEGEDQGFCPVSHLPGEETSWGNVPVATGVNRSQDNFLEEQKRSVKSSIQQRFVLEIRSYLLVSKDQLVTTVQDITTRHGTVYLDLNIINSLGIGQVSVKVHT